jgi:hypothetical protein
MPFAMFPVPHMNRHVDLARLCVITGQEAPGYDLQTT